MKINTIKEAVTRFHNNEKGLAPLEVVMILALAAIVGVLIYAFGENIRDWAKELIEELTGKKDLTDGI